MSQKKLKMVPGYKVVKGKMQTKKQKFVRNRANTLANKLYNDIYSPKNYIKNKINQQKLFSKKNLMKDVKRYSISKQAQFYNLANNYRKQRQNEIQNKRQTKFNKAKDMIKQMNQYHSLYQRNLKQQTPKKKIRKIEVKNLKDYIPIDDTDLEHLTKHLSSQESSKPVILNLDLAKPKVDWSYLNEEKEPIEFIQRYNDHHYNVQTSKETLEKLLQLLQICKYKAEPYYDTQYTYTQVLTEKLMGCPTIFAYTLEVIDKISKWSRNIIYNYVITNGNLIKVQKYVDFFYLTGNMLKDKEMLTFGTFKQAVLNSEGKSFNFDDYKVLYKTNVEYMLNFYNKVFMNYYPTLLFMIKMTQSSQANRILCAYTTNMKFLASFNKIYGIFMRQKNTKPKPQVFNKNDAYQFETNVSRAYSASSIQHRDKKLKNFDQENTEFEYDAEKHKEYLQSIDLENEKSMYENQPLKMYPRDPRRYTDGQDDSVIFVNGELLDKNQAKQKKKHEDAKETMKLQKQVSLFDDQEQHDQMSDLFDIQQQFNSDNKKESPFTFSQTSDESDQDETQKNQQKNKIKDSDTQTTNQNLDKNISQKNDDSSEENVQDQAQQTDDQNLNKVNNQEDSQVQTEAIQSNNQKEKIQSKNMVDQNIQTEDNENVQNNQTQMNTGSQTDLLQDQDDDIPSDLDTTEKQQIAQQINELLKESSEDENINNNVFQNSEQNRYTDSQIQTNESDIDQSLSTIEPQKSELDKQDNLSDNEQPLDLSNQIPTLEDNQDKITNDLNTQSQNQPLNQVVNEQTQKINNKNIIMQEDNVNQNQFQSPSIKIDQNANADNLTKNQNQIQEEGQDEKQQQRMQNLQKSIQDEQNEIDNLKKQMQQKDLQNQQEQYRKNLPVISDDDYLFTKEELESNLNPINQDQNQSTQNMTQLKDQDLNNTNFNYSTQEKSTQTDFSNQANLLQPNNQQPYENIDQSKDTNQPQTNIQITHNINNQNNQQMNTQNTDIINANIQKGYQIKNQIKQTKYSIDNDDNYNFVQKPKKDINAVYINNSNIPSQTNGQPNQQIQITIPNIQDCQNYQIYHYQSKKDCQEHVKKMMRLRRII